MNLKNQWIFFLILCLMMVSCSGGYSDPNQNIDVCTTSYSEKPPPLWIHDIPEDDETYSYKVGASSSFNDESDSRDDALNKAIMNSMTECGVKASYIDKFVTTVIDQNSSNPIETQYEGKSISKLESFAYMVGIKESDYYYEMEKCHQGKEKWKHKVLATRPLDLCKRVDNWRIKTKASLKSQLTNLSGDAKRFFENNKWVQASELAQQAHLGLQQSFFAEDSDFTELAAKLKFQVNTYTNAFLKQKIVSTIQSALHLADTGFLIISFKTLSDTKRIIENYSGILKNHIELQNSIINVEMQIASDIILKPITNTTRFTSLGKSVDLLEFEVIYGKNDTKVRNLQIIFATQKDFIAVPINNGKASLQLPPPDKIGLLKISAIIDTEYIRSKVKMDVVSLDILKKKSLLFQIHVKEDKTLEEKIKPLPKASFHLQLTTEFIKDIKGDIVKISTSCTERCFIKIFNFDQKGVIAVWEDLKSKRYLRNKTYSFQARPDKGTQYLLALGSTKRFSKDFNINKNLSEEEFLKFYNQFKESPDSKVAKFEQFLID
jgi:hypothetical protein